MDLEQDELEAFFEPIFVYFKRDRKAKESFGVFCDRVGFDAIRQFSADYKLGSYMEETTTPKRKFRKNQKRVSVPDELFPHGGFTCGGFGMTLFLAQNFLWRAQVPCALEMNEVAVGQIVVDIIFLCCWGCTVASWGQ